MITANNEIELLTILKIIAEEASKKSKKKLFERGDPAQKRFESELKQFSKDSGVEFVKEEEEADSGEGQFQDDSKKSSGSEQSSDDESSVNNQEKDDDEKEEVNHLDPAQFGSSFDKMVKDINNLRAGRSTKDSEIKNELMGYYDRLSDDERTVLHVFLKQVSSILQGALKGAEAQDPSDAPFNAKIELPGKDKQTDQTDDAREEEADKEKPKQKQKKAKPKRQGNRVEDTTPPIKVNEQQDLNEIRDRVRLLMKRY